MVKSITSKTILDVQRKSTGYLLGVVVTSIINLIIIYYLYNLEDKTCNCIRDWRHDYIKYLSMFMIVYNILSLFFIILIESHIFKIIMVILSIINIYAFFTYITELNNTKCECAVIKQKQIHKFLMVWRYVLFIIPIILIFAIFSLFYLIYTQTLAKDKIYNKINKKFILKN